MFERATKIFTKQLIIFFCKNSLGYSRLGVIVPKRNVNKASQRNSFKRVVREIFRNNQQQLNSLDVVVLFNQKSEELDKKHLNKILTEKFSKIING